MEDGDIYPAMGKSPTGEISASRYSSVQAVPQSLHDIFLNMYLSSPDIASRYKPMIGLGANIFVFELLQDMHLFIG